ncbi:DUF4113 domain-containing protein [Agromyces sp. NPDC055658]
MSKTLGIVFAVVLATLANAARERELVDGAWYVRAGIVLTDPQGESRDARPIRARVRAVQVRAAARPWNRTHGRGAVGFGMGRSERRHRLEDGREKLSPSYTTHWDELAIAKEV